MVQEARVEMNQEHERASLKSVRVSESSRRDARSVTDRENFQVAIDAADEERAALLGQKKQIEAKLAELKATVRGRHVAQRVYNDVCVQQAEIARQLREIEGKLTSIKTRRMRLIADAPRSENPRGPKILTMIHRELVTIRLLLEERLPPRTSS